MARKKYRRKANSGVEAQQFLDPNTPPEGVFMEKNSAQFPMFFVQTLNGKVQVTVGDWIAKEPSGNGFYPIKESVFSVLYEEDV